MVVIVKPLIVRALAGLGQVLGSAGVIRPHPIG